MRSALLLGSTAALCLISACADVHDDDHEHPIDVVAGQNASHTMQGLSHPGRWTIPADVMAIGDQQNVAFNNSPPYDGGSNCTPGPTQGALALRDALISFFPQIASVGIYNCRVIAGTNSMSLHGVGRALDVMIPTVGGAADNDLGDPIAHFLIMNAQAIGIQTIIWDRTIWRVSNNPRQHEYTGSNPHVDHLHVEINLDAAALGPAWYDDPFGPVACETLPAGQNVVDNDHECFQLFGPAQFWRHETVGQGGSLSWTNAWQNATRSNWARWSLPVAEPGEYLVEAFIDPTFGVFNQTRYEVTTSGSTAAIVVDQGAASGWTALGVFTFDGSPGEEVIVVDNHASAVPADQHIVADALRITPADEVPADPVDPGPDPDPNPDPGPGDPDPENPGDDPGPDPSDPGPVDDEDPGLVGPTSIKPSTAGGCASTSPSVTSTIALLALAWAWAVRSSRSSHPRRRSRA